MAEITAYTVQVHGVVEVQATSAEEARQLALAYFAASPMSYISVLGTHQIIVPNPEE